MRRAPSIAHAAGRLPGADARSAVGLRVRSVCVVGALACTLVSLACAGHPRPPTPPDVPAQPIELGRRCPTPPDVASLRPALADDVHRARLASGLDAVVLRLPYAAREVLRLSVPLEAFDSPARARAAFSVWSSGALVADPERFRATLRESGMTLVSAVTGPRIFLALELPHEGVEEAAAALATLLAPEPPPAARLEALRPELALALMAEELAPANAASRLREVVERGEAAVRASSARNALDGHEPEALTAALRSALERTDVVLLYATRAESAAAGFARLDAAMARAMPRTQVAERAIDVARHDRAAPQAAATVLHVLDQPGARQVELLASRATPLVSPRERVTLAMLASLLGDATAGRLFEDLRERQGLAYEIGALQADAHFEVRTRTRPERVAALVTGIEGHWIALGRSPLEPCEVDTLRARMLGAIALETDDAKARLDAWTTQLERAEAPTALADRAALAADIGRQALEQRALELSSRPPDWYLVGDARTLVPRLERAFPRRRILVYDADLSLRRERGPRRP